MEARSPGAVALLFVAFLGPPFVLLAALQANFSFAAFGCDAGHTRAPFLVITLAALALVLGLTALAQWLHRRLGGGVSDARAAGHRSRFLAVGGLALAAQAMAVLVAQVVAILVLGPCP
jgi:hypothetical protein